MKSMTHYKFCFDLDGTICSIKKDGENYIDLLPIPGAVETLKKLKQDGHYIIILTARNMVTHNCNIGKIIAYQSPIVIEWLKKHQIPFDELHFGKPVADFYVDDKGLNFITWDNFKKKGRVINERFFFRYCKSRFY